MSRYPHLPRMWTATAARPPADYARVVIDRTQARSMVIAHRGVVASEHPLASQAGASVLAAGGHAVDAAIAANAVMGVVAPMMSGVGGDLFAIVHDATHDDTIGLNASGWAPAALSPARLDRAGCVTMPQSGIHSVTVPGAVAGWRALHGRFGRLPLSRLLAPAIDVARGGFPVSEVFGAEWVGSDSTLRLDAEATRTFLPGGRAPHVGEIFRNLDLAATYETLVADGLDAFYDGSLARHLVRCSESLGGALAPEDLSAFTAEWVVPLSTEYRGWTVYELPPNGQGFAALLMLNILGLYDLESAGHNSAEALHLIIEAKKLAYADMRRHLADPRCTRIPLEVLLSPRYAAQRARLIDPVHAMHEARSGVVPERGSDTTYLSVVDRDGHMVSLIQSNFANFGSGVVPPGLGFILQNRGGLFSLDPTHPNLLAPRKRPLHTIIPGFMTRHDERIAFGIMGGWNQAQAHVQFVSNVVDHRMNIQLALEVPRVTKLTFDGCDVIVEGRLAARACDGLAERGHDVQMHGEFSSLVGGGQAVARDPDGVNYGASDPRKDGCACPEPFLL